jgi:all-trans-retinol dehydrogenase (NAD+)
MNIVLEIVTTMTEIFVTWLIAACHFFIPPSRKSVKGEIVLITGGGRGLGQRLALEFARLGATVVVWDINLERAENTLQAVKEAGGKCYAYQCDVG